MPLEISCGDEDAILDMAVSAVPSLSRCRAEGVWLDGEWRAVDCPRGRLGAQAGLEAQMAGLGRAGGALHPADLTWLWAFPLSSRGGASGYLVVGSPGPPPDLERPLLQALAQQTGVALAHARLHARERATASEVRTTLGALRRSMDIHDRLTRVAVAGEGLEGIARAVHQLTGHPVAIEDRAGTLLAWAGPTRTPGALPPAGSRCCARRWSPGGRSAYATASWRWPCRERTSSA